jgi:predicted secreted hydrolase
VVAFVAWPLTNGAASRSRVPQATIAVADALGSGDLTGFARALGPRPFAFPDDHGPHPEYRTEWWYYTGNLETAAGRHVGFQLTFFRTALAPPDPGAAAAGASAWRASQLYLAHFALTDTVAGRFHAASRLSREALGLSGARGQPFRVWPEDWSAESGVADGFPLRLRAADGGVALDLVLERGKPVVLQGDRGWSAKGPEPGNASYYYSFTRMPARGTVRVGAESLDVSGLAWMDREWSTSALGQDLAGWDWLALQLDDGRDVMVYQLRRRDGAPDPHSAGTLIAVDGSTRPLAREDATLEVLDHWTSPASRVRYPSRWRLTIPTADLSLEITPRLAAQELIVGTRYWEGAVRVRGMAGGRQVAGRGYVELVGYGE